MPRPSTTSYALPDTAALRRLLEPELAPGVAVVHDPLDRLTRSARVHNAMSSASRGSSVGIDAAVRHPTIRRENTSVTNAVNTIPDQVAT